MHPDAVLSWNLQLKGEKDTLVINPSRNPLNEARRTKSKPQAFDFQVNWLAAPDNYFRV